MAQSLSTLLSAKYTGAGSNFVIQGEENLEKGTIYLYAEGNVYTKFNTGFCWRSPGTGTAVIEMWGAGGSSAQMCCCGFGLAGNAGAYSKRTIQVCSGSFICGCIGQSCGGSSSLCFRGCSEPTMLCWCVGSGCTGCMCAQGGQGGYSYCNTGSGAPFYCYCIQGFCASMQNANVCCGIICLYGSATGSYVACAYGGDVNCCGQFNCTFYGSCCANNPCQNYHTVYIPPGIISTGGTRVVFQTETDTGYGTLNGQALNPFLMGLNAASKQPFQGQAFTHCYGAVNRTCGCYEFNGCAPWVPIGVGGLPVQPCDGVRDHGWRGGTGAVRIKFY
jgi:hypothetical protein